MYLEVMPTGTKIWRMSYRQPNGKNTRLTFGAYPEVSLLNARQKRMDAKKLKAAGTDPAQAKRIDKISKATANANTFEAVAREWHANKTESWQIRTAKNVLHRLEKDVFPLIGKHPIPRIFHTINGLAHFELGHLCFCSRLFFAVWCIESAGVVAKLQHSATVVTAFLQQLNQLRASLRNATICCSFGPNPSGWTKVDRESKPFAKRVVPRIYQMIDSPALAQRCWPV